VSATDNNDDNNNKDDQQISPEKQKEIEDRLENIRKKQQGNDKDNQQREDKSKEKEKEKPPLRPTNIIEDKDQGIWFPKAKYPGYNTEEYNRYLATKRGERQQAIAERLSLQTQFSIPIYEKNDNGNQQDDALLDPDKPFTDKELEETTSLKIVNVLYEFHDAPVKYWHVMQELDYNFSKTLNDVFHVTTNAGVGGITTEEFTELSDRLRAAEDKRYRYGARLFLRMTDDDYNRVANLQLLKDIVDACIHRTTMSVPNYSRTKTT
jgi:hypothetical protein